MLNIFYQNKALNDTLIVNVSTNAAEEVKTNNDITIGYKDHLMVFANIQNASKKIDNSLLSDGLLFPTKDLINYLSSLLNTNMSIYLDNGLKVGLIDKCDAIQGTHLHKCVVNVGNKQLNIVCGASNAKQGLKVVVATHGTILPTGKQIIAGQLLGHASEGMLCSYKELGISKESHGIIELDDSYQVGTYFKEAYANLKK